MAGAAIEVRLEIPAAIRTVARTFMRVPPYERAILEICCRTDRQFKSGSPLRSEGTGPTLVRFLTPESTARPYALFRGLSTMVTVAWTVLLDRRSSRQKC